MWNLLKGVDDYTLGCLPIDDCVEFVLDSALEEKEIPLSLTYAQWQQLTREPFSSELIKASIVRVLSDVYISVALTLPLEQWKIIANFSSITPLLLQLEQEGILRDQNPWIDVNSSCIDAIAFDPPSYTLKIRFNSGDIYQYRDFPYQGYLDFCDADSKGRFFNEYIKDEYETVKL